MKNTSDIIQIQPQYADKDGWTSLAESENLFFEPLELSMGHSRDEAMTEWYRSSGRVTSLHGSFIDINPASYDPDIRSISRKKCMDSCKLAKELGAGHIVFHSAVVPFIRGDYLKNWACASAEFYTMLAETYGLSIYIENSQDPDPQPIAELLKYASHPMINACLDIGHANYSRESLKRWFGTLGSNIRYLHLSDNYGLFDDHLILGEGNTDWEEIRRFRQETSGSMFITLEVGTIRGVKQSLSFLKTNNLFGLGE